MLKSQEKELRNKMRQKMKRKGLAVLCMVFLLSFLNIDTELGQRFLSTNLGGGNCKWTPPEPLGEANPLNTTTMLASYPGSGKRLSWRILEALTGSQTGDDWDHSLNGWDTVLTLKSSWPHPEGVWKWGANMDQLMLLVRNPRFAIPSYHTMRYELDFANDWNHSHTRVDYTYTQRPPIQKWEPWRDEKFEQEMDRWCWFIDFWMQDGLRRNGTHGDGPEQDWRCFHKLMDCTPKAVIVFERLVSPDPVIGDIEMTKIGSVLDASPNVNAIEPEARSCVYKEVLNRREFYNANRNGVGPAPELKVFNHTQLNAMREQVEILRDKYSTGNWTEDPNAIDLVDALNFYIDEIQADYETTVQEYYAENQ